MGTWKGPGRMEKVHDLYTLIHIHKKGSTLDCENFRTISLIGHMGKVLMMILTEFTWKNIYQTNRQGFARTGARHNR